jgi:sulfur-carrier protein adenylyltransferase/sulfurtransferase
MTPGPCETNPGDGRCEHDGMPSGTEGVNIEISPQEARRLLEEKSDAVLVDIRPDWEARLGHIEGARFIPVGSLEEELGNLAVSRDTPIILCCSSGNRSLAAARRLAERGYRYSRSIGGGYISWMNSGYPIVKESEFSVEQLNRYSRQILLGEIGEEGQLRLLKTKILLVGAGGLGSPAGLYLAAAGVGTLGIADFDVVDLSNLNRQIFHGVDDVGKLKTESARRAIQGLNPDVNVITYTDRINAQNILEIIEGYDIVIDAADNVETKFLLNDACFFSGKPYIYGGAVQLEGQMSVFHPKGGGPCLRCLFPVPPPPNLVPT